MSQDTSVSAPESRTADTLSLSIPSEMCGSLTEKLPPNPQQVSAFRISFSSRPGIARSRDCGASLTSISRSR